MRTAARADGARTSEGMASFGELMSDPEAATKPEADAAAKTDPTVPQASPGPGLPIPLPLPQGPAAPAAAAPEGSPEATPTPPVVSDLASAEAAAPVMTTQPPAAPTPAPASGSVPPPNAYAKANTPPAPRPVAEPSEATAVEPPSEPDAAPRGEGHRADLAEPPLAAASRPALTAAPTPAAADAQPLLRAAAAPDWQLVHELSAAPHARATPRVSGPVHPHAASPEAVVSQVAGGIGKANERKLEIRLDPPELGRVQIQLTTTDTGLQAVVLAQRAETHDLLRRHAEMLAQELASAGYGSVDLSFGNAPAERRDTPGSDAWLARIEADAAPAASATTAARAPTPRGTLAIAGLDIRL